MQNGQRGSSYTVTVWGAAGSPTTISAPSTFAGSFASVAASGEVFTVSSACEDAPEPEPEEQAAAERPSAAAAATATAARRKLRTPMKNQPFGTK